MPELPEVENLRRGLEWAILGARVKRVSVKRPKLVSGKGNLRIASEKKRRAFIRGVTGEKFLAIERRAKNLVFKLSRGKIILAHLKMSGQFAYKSKIYNLKSVIGGHPIEISETKLPNKHTHIIFELSKGTLYYNDTRMFGYVLYYPSLRSFEAENHFGLLGLEPFDVKFTAAYLFDTLENKRSKIKAVLMEQKIVTGLGNIYADEALFTAGVRPTRSSSSITPTEAKKLHSAIVSIMKRATRVGGSSVATYRLLDLSRGNYAREHQVYGKAGIPCPRCGTLLKRILVQSRGTVFCPRCQK